jgi:hypothetical protein
MCRCGSEFIMVAYRKMALRAVLTALMGFVCVQCSDGQRSDPVALLDAAITAHGGRDRLAQLDDLRVVSEAHFKGTLPMRRTVHWRGAGTWAMALEVDGKVVMRVGMSEGRCWKKDRHLVSECSPIDAQELRRIALLFDARLLHHVDRSAVAPSPAIEIEGVSSPALRAGDLVLVFDPASHRLVQVRLEDRIDTLSDYRDVGGALIAARRVLTIAGKLDIDETWTQIEPGRADAEAIRSPQLPRAGLVIDETDLPRPVAWMEVDDPERDAPAASKMLDDFVREQGRRPGYADGLILMPPENTASAGRWQLAVGVEATTPLVPTAQAGLHLDVLPEMRFLGIFLNGDTPAIVTQRDQLQRLLEERNLRPAAGARWQILLPRDALGRAPAERLSLLRIAVD